jgi:PAP2 superfamily
MAVNEQELYARSEARDSASSFARRLAQEMGAHDWLVLAYLVVLNVAVLEAPAGIVQTQSLHRVAFLLAFLIATLVLVRGRVLQHKFFAPMLYRLAIYGTVQVSYFFLAEILPLVNSSSVDFGLYHFDLHFFGFEPALALDHLVSPITTEWFAFFYYGYFFLLALHVVPILMLSRRQRLLSEFSLGMLIVFCLGHTLYMIVPGFGPHEAMADQFSHALPRGMWLDTVMRTVAEGGAQKDIFPSLHTAAPAFIAMFSFRHRDKVPYRYTWPAVAFFTVNIICATMFLRWHYIIDVVAGLALSMTALVVAARVTRWDMARRARLGLGQNWPLFFEREDQTTAARREAFGNFGSSEPVAAE